MAAVAPEAHSGRCHCGAVSYSAAGLQNIWFCHCRECRRLTGHYMAAARAPVDSVKITGDVRWTPVSERAAYGSCAACASPMFWRNRERETLSVVAGSLDGSAGLETKGHVFVAEKGDYYDIADGLPQFAGYPEGGV